MATTPGLPLSGEDLRRIAYVRQVLLFCAMELDELDADLGRDIVGMLYRVDALLALAPGAAPEPKASRTGLH